MFKRVNRLPNARAVKRLYAKGRRLVKPTVFLFVAPTQARAPRFSVVVGKKVSARAVDRNRLKRVARAVALVLLPDQLPVVDYLIVLRPAALKAEANLRSDLGELLKTSSSKA